MMAFFYDRGADPGINAIADDAIRFVNDLYKEESRPSICVAEVCLWSAQKLAPAATASEHRLMGRAAYQQLVGVLRIFRELPEEAWGRA